MNWKRELAALVRADLGTVSGARDYSMSRPSRRTHASPQVVLPAMRQPPPPRVTVVIDTSGSVDDAMLDQGLAEVRAILRLCSVGSREVTVLGVDATVQTGRKVRSVSQVALAGGGGTDMRVGIDRALAARPRPHLVVVLTDGMTPWPSEDPGTPVTAVLLGPYGKNAAGAVPAWMRKVVVPA